MDAGELTECHMPHSLGAVSSFDVLWWLFPKVTEIGNFVTKIWKVSDDKLSDKLKSQENQQCWLAWQSILVATWRNPSYDDLIGANIKA